MAIDFEALINKHAGEDGNISAGNIAKMASAISSAVGREFVAKERYNAKLDEIETLKGEKQAAEDNAAAANKYKGKYEKEHADFEAFKADTEEKAKLSSVKAAYRKLLEESSIDHSLLDTIIEATRFDGMKLGDDGKLEKADELKTAIDGKWAKFKVTTRTDGAKVDNPPKNADGNGANSRAAELARQFHERRYGKAPTTNGGNNNN